MDIKSPSSEPSKSYEKSNTEKTNTEKAEKQEVALKPNDKPKPKNKIERPKIDSQKEPKNKIQREKIDLDAPTKNKIERPKIDLNKEIRNKIQREKIDLSTPAKNKIERHKIDLHKESRNKIQREKIDLDSPVRNKIERIPTNDSKNTIKPEGNQLSLEQTKEEMKQINWKSVSENWSINVKTNKHTKYNLPLDPTKEPSKENPLYKHKQWLQTVYKNQNWKVDDKKLAKISGVDYKTIWRSRKKFNIPTTSQPRRKSINDGTQKECGRCHETKSINDFEIYNRNDAAKRHRERYCRPCRQEYKQIRALTNKNNIIRNIYGGKYGNKCPGCDTTVAKLPAFDFHHPIKELKTGTMNFHGNWEKTLKRLEKEKVIPSCRNCHLKEQPKFYKKYKNLIEHKNEFESSLEGIEGKLYKQIYKQYPGIGHKEGHQIKSWMSKRIAVDRLYNGGCIGCGEKNLATLQFHHRDRDKKTFQKYDKLRYTTLQKIEKILIKDDAVCLCGNCHRMITTKHYEKNHQEIVGIKYSQEIKKIFFNLKENIKNYEFPANFLKQYPNIETEKIEIGGRKPNFYKLNPIEKRIKEEIMAFDWRNFSQNWKLPSGEVLDPTKESSIINPLYKHKYWLKTVYSNKNWNLSDPKIARLTNTSKTTINYWRNKLQINVKNSNLQNTRLDFGEAWKKYLFHISKLSREGKTVQTKTLAESVGVKPSITRANIRKLISKGLISINGEHKKRTVILTVKGEKELKRNREE